jgi:hypothetical protein
MLRREVLEACRRRWGLLIPALALPCLWLAWPEDRVEVRTVHTREVVTVPVPVAFEQPVQIPAEPARCPLPRTDAPLVQPAQPPEHVASVRPAPTNAGWVAAWSPSAIFVSRDAGATWTRVLDGAGTVADVSFDCFGRVIAVRGGRVGIRDGAHERWRTAPLDLGADKPARVLGGGPDLVVIARVADDPGARLAISRDGGQTWGTRKLAPYWEGEPIRGRQYEDGTIRGAVPVTDCDYYALWMFRIHDDKIDSIEHGRYEPRERLFAKDEDGASYEVGFDESIDGPVPLQLRDREVERLVSGKPRSTHWIVGDRQTAAGDAAGHVWSVVCGKLEIATARATRGSGPHDGSSGAADAAGCDPS